MPASLEIREWRCCHLASATGHARSADVSRGPVPAQRSVHGPHLAVFAGPGSPTRRSHLIAHDTAGRQGSQAWQGQLTGTSCHDTELNVVLVCVWLCVWLCVCVCYTLHFGDVSYPAMKQHGDVASCHRCSVCHCGIGALQAHSPYTKSNVQRQHKVHHHHNNTRRWKSESSVSESATAVVDVVQDGGDAAVEAGAEGAVDDGAAALEHLVQPPHRCVGNPNLCIECAVARRTYAVVRE
jgi:hypothetical protein